VSIGDTLAAARRQAGLTITQVSQRTCIRETIVRGIEREDYSACGGDFYARGHVRSIARAVGLEPDEAVREYDATQSPHSQITAAEVFQPFTPVKLRERRRPNWTVVLLVGIVAIAGIVGFRYFSHNSSPRPTAGGSPSHSAKHSAPASPAAHASPTQVQITVVAKPGSVTWAELTAANGQVLFQGDIGAGAAVTQFSSTAGSTMTVRLGNPGGADVFLNGKKQANSATQPITLTCTPASCA
jgi:cytoskeletal protein RodZ